MSDHFVLTPWGIIPLVDTVEICGICARIMKWTDEEWNEPQKACFAEIHMRRHGMVK